MHETIAPQLNPAGEAERRGGPDRPEAADPRYWLALLRRRWRPAAITGAVVFVLIVVLASMMTPKFQSDVSILAKPGGEQDVTAAPTTTPVVSVADSNAVDTDVQILGSRSLAAQVVRQLDLTHDEEFSPAMKKPPTGFMAFVHGLKASIFPPKPGGNLNETVIDTLIKHVTARRAGLTYVIDVKATSKDANKAARIANAVAQAFINQQMQAQADQARAVTEAISPRLTQLNRNMVSADAQVQQFKNAHDLLSANGATMAEEEASNYNQQIAIAKADYAEKVARLQAAEAQIQHGGGGADVGAALSSDTIRALRAQEAEASQKLADLSSRYGDRYPDVVTAKNQLHDIRSQIQQEIDRIISSLKADAQVAGQRVASLEGSLHNAQAKLAQNNAAQVGLMQLQNNADSIRGVQGAFSSAAKVSAAQEGVLQPDARIVSLARPSNQPAWPNLRLVIVLGAGVAMMAALAAVGLLELLNDGLETSAQLEQKLDIPSVGTVPILKSTVKRGTNPGAPHLYVPKHPLSAFAEAFRGLRTHLMLRGGAKNAPKVVAITSALPNEGKSTTALCLAQTYALNGSRVVLVDCDLRQSGISKISGANDIGVVEVLSGKGDLKDALKQDQVSGAWILPVIPGAMTGSDIFTPEAVDRLLDLLRPHFDVILLDTAPILAVADTRVIAAKADAALLVVLWRKTPARAADAAVQLLFDAGANIAGAVLSCVDLRQQSRTGYGDRDYYFNSVKSYYFN